MLLNFLQCTGRPLTKNYPAQNINHSKDENHALKPCIITITYLIIQGLTFCMGMNCLEKKREKDSSVFLYPFTEFRLNKDALTV